MQSTYNKTKKQLNDRDSKRKFKPITIEDLLRTEHPLDETIRNIREFKKCLEDAKDNGRFFKLLAYKDKLGGYKEVLKKYNQTYALSDLDFYVEYRIEKRLSESFTSALQSFLEQAVKILTGTGASSDEMKSLMSSFDTLKTFFQTYEKGLKGDQLKEAVDIYGQGVKVFAELKAKLNPFSLNPTLYDGFKEEGEDSDTSTSTRSAAPSTPVASG